MTELERLIKLCQKLPLTEQLLETLPEYGFPVSYVAEGLSRQVYKVKDLPVVIKLEGFKNPGTCWQSPSEIKTIRLITKSKKYKCLRLYIPEVYYSKLRERECLIVARFYPFTYKDVHANFHSKNEQNIGDLFQPFQLTNIGEMCGSNIRYTESFQPVVVDLGYGT